MHNEEDTLLNACADLVTSKAHEAFPLSLLRDHETGSWVRVREICERAGIAACDVKSDLFATWLPDPMGNEHYAVVLFYDDETKWSMAAQYNRERILANWGQAAAHHQPRVAPLALPTASTSA